MKARIYFTAIGLLFLFIFPNQWLKAQSNSNQPGVNDPYSSPITLTTADPNHNGFSIDCIDGASGGNIVYTKKTVCYNDLLTFTKVDPATQNPMVIPPNHSGKWVIRRDNTFKSSGSSTYASIIANYTSASNTYTINGNLANGFSKFGGNYRTTFYLINNTTQIAIDSANYYFFMFGDINTPIGFITSPTNLCNKIRILLPDYEVYEFSCPESNITSSNPITILWGDGDSTAILKEGWKYALFDSLIPLGWGSHVYNNPGIYFPKIIEYTPCGTRMSATRAVVVGNPIVNLLASTVDICTNINPNVTLSATISSYTNNYTIQWTATANGATTVLPFTTATITDAPKYPTVYTITITDTRGCTTTKSVSVNVVHDCCIGNNNMTMVGGNISTLINSYPNAFVLNGSFKQFSNTVAAQTITLNGNIVIDQNFDISNCPNVYMGPNARIRINPNITLKISNSTLRACSDMWEGIIDSGSTTQLFISGSTISDAKTVVSAKNNAYFSIKNNSFINNWRTMNIENYMQAAYISSQVYGNNISCSPTGLKAPYLGQIADAGIICTNVKNLSIGDYGLGYGNTFNYLKAGIVSKESAVKVKQNKFTNIRGNFPSTIRNPWHGVAIYTTSDYVTRIFSSPPNGYLPLLEVNTNGSTLTTGSPAAFSNCDTAILVYATPATLQYNKIENTTVGVKSPLLVTANLNILDNELNNVYQGVMLSNIWLANYKINRNVIVTAIATLGRVIPGVVYNPPYGIRIDNTTLGPENQYTDEITGNTLTNGYNNIAIFNSAKKLLIGNSNDNDLSGINTINVTNGCNLLNCLTFHTSGIYAEKSSNLNIRNNMIAGNNVNKNYGIQFYNSKDYNMGCNRTEYFKHGMYFMADCNPGKGIMDQNRTSNCLVHWMVDKVASIDGFIGNQVGSLNDGFENRFLNSYQKHTYVNNTNGQYNYIKPIYYKKDQFNNYPTYAPTVNQSFLSSDRFDVQATYPNASLRLSCQINGNMTAPEGGNNTLDFMEDIASGALSFSSYQEATEWLLKKDLFEKLDKEESLRLSSAILANFYTDEKQNDIGKITELEKAGQQEDWQTLADREEVIAKMQEVYSSWDSVEAGNVYAQNIEWVEKLNWEIIKNSDFKIDELTTTRLHDLATSCPYIAGPAVHKARALYSSLVEPIAVDDKALCASQGFYKKATDDNEYATFSDEIITPDPLAEVRLLTNPVASVLTISYELTTDKGGTVEVYNLLGSRVAVATFKGYFGECNVNIKHLASGEYLARIISGEGFAKTFKFIKMD